MERLGDELDASALDHRNGRTRKCLVVDLLIMQGEGRVPGRVRDVPIDESKSGLLQGRLNGAVLWIERVLEGEGLHELVVVRQGAGACIDNDPTAGGERTLPEGNDDRGTSRNQTRRVPPIHHPGGGNDRKGVLRDAADNDRLEGVERTLPDARRGDGLADVAGARLGDVGCACHQ